MDKKKIKEVIDIYRKKFEDLNVEKSAYPHEENLCSPESGLSHCHSMLDKMEKFLDEDRIEKSFRWLGFIQGVLWSQKIYTLTDLMNHNKPS